MHTSSPGFPSGSGRPPSSKTSTCIPRARHWISPRHTGAAGFPWAKQPMRSVPPVIEERRTSGLTASYTKSKVSGTRGEPVDRIARTLERSCVSRGRSPDFLTASRYLAEVPKRSIPAASAKSKSARMSGQPGEPS